MATLMERNLMKLRIGAIVEMTYDEGDISNKKIAGVVIENDGIEGLQVRLKNGEEPVITYSLVRSFKEVKELPKDNDNSVPPPPPPIPKRIPLYLQDPENVLNRNDAELKNLYGEIPYGEKKLLSRVYDSFVYGVRTNDQGKMTAAANLGRQIIFQEDDRKYDWSNEAVLFCASLLRRVGISDSEVCLVSYRFYEAALCARRNGKHNEAGAYAVAGLLEKEPEYVRDLFIVLAAAIVQTGDISGLQMLELMAGDRFRAELRELTGDLLAAKGIHVTTGQEPAAAMAVLKTLYTADEKMEITAIDWLTDEMREEYQNKKRGTVPNPPPPPPKPITMWGFIRRIDWAKHTGVISGDDAQEYTFHYKDITHAGMKKSIENAMRADLGGKRWDVRFQALDKAASQIVPTAEYVERARSIAAGTREDRYEAAYALCRVAQETNKDARRASGDLIRYALELHKKNPDSDVIDRTLAVFESCIKQFPENPNAYLDVARCYAMLKKTGPSLEYARKGLRCPGQNVRQKLTSLQQYLKMVWTQFEASGDRKLLSQMLEQIRDVRKEYGAQIDGDSAIRGIFINNISAYQIQCECGLDLLEEAEASFALLHAGHPRREFLRELLEQTRQRLQPAEPEQTEVSEAPAEPEQPEASEAPAELEQLEESEAPAEPEQPGESEAPAEPEEPGESEAPAEPELPAEPPVPMKPAEPEPPAEPEEEPEEDIPLVPYKDHDGWEALKTTKQEVVDYALAIPGPDRIAPMLAYLRVGAELNPQIRPVYHTVALAANDPLESLDYSTTALITALSENDTEYPELNNLCMGAAFLRSSFLYGRDYDYSIQSLRDSLILDQQMDAFREVCDTLDAFRREAGRPIDIYAEYRNRDLMQVREELEKTAAHADELYTKFVLMPPREGADFFRLVRTKQLVFAQEGYLATMLRRIMDRDQEALENEREHFAAAYLSGSGPLESRHVSQSAVDQLIADTWEEAGRGMMSEKNNNTLQGDRRNNLRSNISDILRTITRWYVLSEQSAGLTWQTKQGEQAYERMQPVLLAQLGQLQQECDSLQEVAPDAQTGAGLFLLSAAARELQARLDGSWKCGRENYLYADFLRSGLICLDESFMPQLHATFCVLPEFNILNRIRRHVEEPRLSWQEQIDRIYGRDIVCNNYGTADQIAEYLAFLGGEETVTFPEKREDYINRTKAQIEIRYCSFRETYALAMNRGQIINSDAFCYGLEDTARYWSAVCRSSRNYGFLAQLLHHCEEQIRTVARQYEQVLEKHLKALIASNPQDFEKHPEYETAIRGEIANQNFTVAENWMARIRTGGFSLEVEKPQALKDLEHYFFNQYSDIYKRVADASRTLYGLLGRKDVRNKDTKRGQQLIDNWIYASSNTGTERMRQLLNLLGWPSIQVTQLNYPTNIRAELYRVTSVADQSVLTAPQHPIAAFGSDLEKPLDPDKMQQHMYVACLYGIYDCERLYDQMRLLDGIQGSKIFLLDYALSHSERRKLARKLKDRGTCLDNVNMVIDRVLITYLADNYNENLINRILMATAMPFSYCQPYVVDSIQTMPPEIFIGRKDELRRIERYDGVNLIYGGRQLGKSALFKKAVSDLDGRGGQRAIRVDIKDKDCAAAARKVSMELIGKGILPPDSRITDDWDELCLNIKMRLRSKTDEISYFLLMLDEADVFIKSSAACNYSPLVALKDVQETMQKRFKYVLAGLHDVVKFNRDVALGRNSVITHMSSLKITPFYDKEATELLTGPLSYLGFSLPNKVTVSQILATCNYFPGLIQLYAQKLIESVQAADYAGYSARNSPPYVVTDDHLRRVMSDKAFVDTIYEKFEITLKLDEDQGSCYYPLALLIGWMYYMVDSESGYTARDVLHYAKDLHIAPLEELDEEKIDALLQELQDLNILRSVSSNSYLLASKNFRDLLGSDEEINEKLTEIGGRKA